VPIIVPDRLDLVQMALDDPITRAMPLRDGASVALPEDMAYAFIVFTCRTGSFYLADLLATSGYFNSADEDLAFGPVTQRCARDNIGSFSEYFSALSRTGSRNNVLVLKCSAAQLVLLAWHGLLQRIVRRSRFIFLERMDKLAQAISWSIAVQTSRYRSFDETADITPVYDGADIADRIARIAYENAQIALFLGINGIVPLHIVYERMAAAPLEHGRNVCRFLGHPELVCDPARIRLLRQATDRNRAWRARFLAERTQPAAGS